MRGQSKFKMKDVKELDEKIIAEEKVQKEKWIEEGDDVERG